MESNIKIFPKSVVCEESTLRGDITFSSGCVVHPSATIIAEAGPIIIGENCIVEEYATITHRLQPGASWDVNKILSIGGHNVFEVGCNVEASRIGDKNVFESKCYVGSGVSVSSGCVIGAGIQICMAQQLPENTIVYGQQALQREAIEKQGSQTLQIDFLRKVLPNYHHLRKPNYDPKKARSVV
ncbi:l-2-37Ce [Drosophila busckii]|uniref:Dynactin subunit 6 n=1 Tax=Drosophila busckii TaxID=30019 RepID=A0A0M5JAU4_DROBS|nr:dynactin subunit 6 [Drosophila busckii]ALC42868.1 l-2-37Ce [Drosophila busckii]